MLKKVLMITAVLFLSGCAAVTLHNRYKNLSLNTDVTRDIFLTPTNPSQTMVYVKIYNLSGNSVFNIKQSVYSALADKGYKITNDSTKANVIVQLNLRPVQSVRIDVNSNVKTVTRTRTSPAGNVTSETTVVKKENTNDDGSAVGGAVLGGVVGSTLGQGKGSLLGAAAGALTGALASSYINSSSYAMSYTVSANLHIVQNINGKKFNHDTRIISNATQIKLTPSAADAILARQLTNVVVNYF